MLNRKKNRIHKSKATHIISIPELPAKPTIFQLSEDRFDAVLSMHLQNYRDTV